jgi:hypothetical protein
LWRKFGSQMFRHVCVRPVYVIMTSQPKSRPSSCPSCSPPIIPTKYSRYLPISMLLMNRLPDVVVTAFEQGEFTAKALPGKVQCCMDGLHPGATENKALKGTGGITGLTLRGPALARWFLGRPVTAQYSARFPEWICLAGQKAKNKQPPQKATQKRWNTDVKRMMQMFDGACIDPFKLFADLSSRLVNFATGAIAPPAIENSMGIALSKGAAMAKAFIADHFKFIVVELPRG